MSEVATLIQSAARTRGIVSPQALRTHLVEAGVPVSRNTAKNWWDGKTAVEQRKQIGVAAALGIDLSVLASACTRMVSA